MEARRNSGFTIVELIITMAVFALTIVAASNIFVGLLSQFKQQSKIAETNIEGIIGLEILRRDLASAGYGLPWSYPAGFAYQEAENEGATPTINETDYNDSTAPNPARGLVSGDGDGDGIGGVINDTDVLVIKSVNVATNDAAQKWTYVNSSNEVHEWNPAAERPANGDRMIVITTGDTRRLVVIGGPSFTARYVAATNPDSLTGGFAPTTNPLETRIAYGVANPNNATNLRFPFNRANYFVMTPASMPSRCAGGTGILYKGTVNQGDGGLTMLPLLDCVADFQVVYRRDTDNDGTTDLTTNDISALTAQQVREQVKDVRVYILAHEGQRDPNFTFSNFTGACANCIRVGESAALGRDLDISGIANYLNYRWKIYTIAVKPNI